MKVALVTDSFSAGGGLEHIFQICRGLPNVEFGVFGKGGSATGKFEALDNVTVFDKGFGPRYISNFNPDVVHVHHIRPLLIVTWLKVKIVFTVHGVHLHKYEFSNKFLAPLLWWLRLNLERWAYKRVDEVLTVSSDDQTYLLENHHVESKVIHNGLDFSLVHNITASKRELRRQLKLPIADKIFLMVARFDFAKAHEVLIKAIQLLKDRGELVEKKFVLVGDGEGYNRIKKSVIDLSLSGSVIFLGSRDDVYNIMKASDVFVLTSRWEGLPITLIEALACHLPVIASDTYGIRSIYMLGNSASMTLFEKLDHVDLADKLLDTPVFNGSNVEEVFNSKTMNKELLRVYQ